MPADSCELSVKARQRGRPHPPNRGGTAETGQENLGVSRASRSVEGHRRLQVRTAPGLLEGPGGTGVGGEPCERASPNASGIAGHRRAGGNVERGGGVAWISLGRGGGSHREQADPGRIWTSVLAVLCVPGGRARASTRRTGGSGPKINKRSSRKSGGWVRVLGGQGSVRAALPMNRQLRADRRQTLFDHFLLVAAGSGRHGVKGRMHRGVTFVMGAHDRPTARQRTGMRPRSLREVKGSSKIFSRPDAQVSGWIQRRGRSWARCRGAGSQAAQVPRHLPTAGHPRFVTCDRSMWLPRFATAFLPASWRSSVQPSPRPRSRASSVATTCRPAP